MLSGERASVAAPFINTGTLKTDGLDLAVNWRRPRKGSFYINSLITFLGKYDVQDARTGPIVHEKDTCDAGGGQFKYKLTHDVRIQLRRRQSPSVGMQWRYLPENQGRVARA